MDAIDIGGEQSIPLSEHSEACQRRALKNLRYLYQTRGISQHRMCRRFDDWGVALSQGNISKYLDGKLAMPLGFLAYIGRVFDVSIEDILLRDIEREEHREALREAEPMREDGENPLRVSQRMFVTGCAAPEIAAILGTYHCYLFPTKPYPADYFSGTFRIYENERGTCSIRMDVGIRVEAGAEPIEKTYAGALYYSKGMLGSFCVIKNEDSGEIVFMILKTYHPTSTPLQCAILPVLSMGRGHSDSAPFCHRLLIARDAIREEDMPLVLPFLHMTGADMWIRAQDVAACERAVQAAHGVPDILRRAGVRAMPSAAEERSGYIVSEKALLSAIEASVDRRAYGTTYPRILAIVRSYADAERRNAVGADLDRTVYDLLHALGYHRESYL